MSVALTRNEAQALFDQIIGSVEVMLQKFRIHGDLSAYNVLYWRGEALLIDFPQIVDALHHPTAFSIFSRDIDRLCGYFIRQGLELDPVGLARGLWERWIA
jgi:RIO kinase 1